MKFINCIRRWLQPHVTITNMTLTEAEELLLAAVPVDRSVNIRLSVWHYDHHPNRNQRVVSFEVWDERENYQGTTLAEAVNRCIAAQSSYPAASNADIEVLITEAEREEQIIAATPSLQDPRELGNIDDVPF